MKYRFKVYEVSKDGGTGLVCGQAPSLITDFSDLTINLVVNGTEIQNGIVAVGGGNPSTVTTTTTVGSLTVTLTVLDTGQITITIPTTRYDENHTLFIKLTKPGANVYENTLTVHGYDLGNDATVTNDLGLPVTSNPDMDVVLVDETATDTFTKFVGYNIPLTSNVALVELASGDGLTTYHKALTAEVVGTGIATTASIQNLDYYSKSYRADTGVSCMSNSKALALWNYCPTINMSVINGRYDEFMVRSNVTGTAVRSSLDFMDIARIAINDVVTSPFISPRLVYTLRNRLGEVVTATTLMLNFTNIFSAGYNSNLTDWALPVLDITQNYTVTAEIISDCQFNCVSTLIIPFCYTEDITHVECNNYVLTNNIPVTVTVSVNKWNGTAFIEATNHILVADSSKAIELTDGVYQIRFTRGEEFYNRIVLADCGIRTCIMTLIQDFVCKAVTINCDCESTCSCTNVQYINDKDLFDVNMINIQYVQYLNLVNHLLNLNPIFTTLNDETEAAIIQIDKLIQAFSVYCETCK